MDITSYILLGSWCNLFMLVATIVTDNGWSGNMGVNCNAQTFSSSKSIFAIGPKSLVLSRESVSLSFEQALCSIKERAEDSAWFSWKDVLLTLKGALCVILCHSRSTESAQLFEIFTLLMHKGHKSYSKSVLHDQCKYGHQRNKRSKCNNQTNNT